MKIGKIALQTAFVEKNVKLFQEIFDEHAITEKGDRFHFPLEDCEVTFIQGNDPTLAEITLTLDIDHSLQDFAHRLQFIFYSQFGEHYEPSVDLRANRVTFYDFDGRIWHLEVTTRF